MSRLQVFIILCLAISAYGLRTKVLDRKIVDENRDLRLSVTTKIELDKCNDLRQMLLDSKYGYKLECSLDTIDMGIENVREGRSDFVVLEYQDEILARNMGLRPYLYEEYSKDSYVVAVTDENVVMDDILMRPLDFDMDDVRVMRSVILFNTIRQSRNNVCDRVLPIRDERSIRIIRSNQLRDYDLTGKVLICPDMKVRDVTLYEKCNFDTGSARTIYGRDVDDEKLSLINYFRQIVNVFKGKLQSQPLDQLTMFGDYRGVRNVLFDNDVIDFSLLRKIRNGLDEITLRQLYCLDVDQQQIVDINRYQPNLMMMQNVYSRPLERYRQYIDNDITYRPIQDVYGYRQYVGEDRYQPLTDWRMLYRPQVISDINPYYNVVDRIRRQVSDVVYPYRQLTAADRFREMLNLDQQYRQQQQYSYPDDYYRQYLDADRLRLLSDVDRTYQPLNLDRFRQVYDINSQGQMLDGDMIRQAPEYQQLNLDVGRQMLDKDVILQTPEYQQLNLDRYRQVYDIDSKRQMLEKYMLRQQLNLDRYRQMNDIYNRRQVLDKNIIRQTPEYQQLNLGVGRQMLDKDVIRQAQDIQQLKLDRYRQVNDIDSSRRQMLDKDVNRQTPEYQQLNLGVGRQMLDKDVIRQAQDIQQLKLDRYRQVNDIDNSRRQMLDKDVNRQTPEYQQLNLDRYRQVNDIDNSRRQMLDKDVNRQTPEYQQLNFDRYGQVNDIDSSRRQMLDKDVNRQTPEYQQINLDRYRQLNDIDSTKRQMLDKDVIRQTPEYQQLNLNRYRQVNDIDNSRRQMLDKDVNRQTPEYQQLNFDRYGQVNDIDNSRRQMLDKDVNRQAQDYQQLNLDRYGQLNDLDSSRRQMLYKDVILQTPDYQQLNLDRYRQVNDLDSSRRQMLDKELMRQTPSEYYQQNLLDTDRYRGQYVNKDLMYRQKYGADRQIYGIGRQIYGTEDPNMSYRSNLYNNGGIYRQQDLVDIVGNRKDSKLARDSKEFDVMEHERIDLDKKHQMTMKRDSKTDKDDKRSRL